MNRDTLRYFHMLCELKSINAVANAIPMTAQGLRKSLHALESELNAKLYVGTTQGVVITPAGERLDKFYLEIEPSYGSLLRDLARIGASPDAVADVCFSFGSFGLVSDAVLSCGEEHPEMDIRITSLPERSLVQEMEAGAFDFSVTWGAPASSMLTYRHVTDIDMYAVARLDCPALQSGPIRIKDFDGQDIVSIGDYHKPHQLFMQRCKEEGVSPLCRYITAEMPVTQAYLRQGLGIGLALRSERSVYDPSIFAFEQIEDFAIPIGIAYRHEHEPSGACGTLADAISEALRAAAQS